MKLYGGAHPNTPSLKQKFEKSVALFLFGLIKASRNKHVRQTTLGVIALFAIVGTVILADNLYAKSKQPATTVTTVEDPIVVYPVAEPDPETLAREAEARNYRTVIFNPEVRRMMAQVLYAEAGCVESDAERSMVLWTILNRYDSGIEWFGGDLTEIMTKEDQFAYNPYGDYTRADIDLVNDVVERYIAEKMGEQNVGRTLPARFCFFHTDYETEGWHNYFYALSEGLSGDVEIYDRDHPVENPYTPWSQGPVGTETISA